MKNKNVQMISAESIKTLAEKRAQTKALIETKQAEAYKL